MHIHLKLEFRRIIILGIIGTINNHRFVFTVNISRTSQKKIILKARIMKELTKGITILSRLNEISDAPFVVEFVVVDCEPEGGVVVVVVVVGVVVVVDSGGSLPSVVVVDCEPEGGVVVVDSGGSLPSQPK